MDAMTFRTWLILAASVVAANLASAQQRLPDTGQISGFTETFGEDSDYSLNPPHFADNGNGAVVDLVTGLMWQKMDGGEMTFSSAKQYADTLELGGYSDWRLPSAHELFGILNHGMAHPALDITSFDATSAEYWWTVEPRADDPSRVWVANAGGGIGAHSVSETISAGGTRRIHVRCVRGAGQMTPELTTNDNSTITDNASGLMWIAALSADSLTWEDALKYCESHSFAGFDDWRLPNIKELHSLTSTARIKPCFTAPPLAQLQSCRIWSSTTLNDQPALAWDVQTDFGIVSYSPKTRRQYALCVRGGFSDTLPVPELAAIPGGAFEMGDHQGFVDPQHPSDETPIHTVRVDSFFIARTETTNAQYLAFLQSALDANDIEVRNGLVYATGTASLFCYTTQAAEWSGIAWNNGGFSHAGFRSEHPMVGVMWLGAAAYCNWLSVRQGLDACYNLETQECDFTRNGYRLPTEAEWEYAGRGGLYAPYCIFPWGNDADSTKANWPASNDPYEAGPYPWTTPVGFYNGGLRLKSEFQWPGTQISYQTSNGANNYGLYDMSGNVWEFVNDWYGQKYYSESPIDNPKGPVTGFIMPDGKPYRGMRGGNWYNGQWGHGRVANRNPSYYRGPQDPNHPWYHVGFRIARSNRSTSTNAVAPEYSIQEDAQLLPSFPNPATTETTIPVSIRISAHATLRVYDVFGRCIATLHDGLLSPGVQQFGFQAATFPDGMYYVVLKTAHSIRTLPLVVRH